MKGNSKRLTLRLTLASLILLMPISLAFGQPVPGKPVPEFSLKDMSGNVFDLSKMKTKPMLVLYFFDAQSQSSLDGLLTLDKLIKKYSQADLKVWGITLSGSSKTKTFIKKYKPTFPVMLDTEKVSDVYDAKLILPTVCIVGPELKLMDYFQGGGKSTEVMLLRLAERELSQKQTAIASAIGQTVEKKNPKSVEARSIQGYAKLADGEVQKAGQVFEKMSKDKGADEIAGKEGLAAVYAKQGQTEKALALATEVEKKAPQRPYANVIKGNILYGQNQKQAAEKEFQKAVAKKEGTSFQKAVAFNQLGRVYANQANYSKARDLYDQAVDLDPYYVEATSNIGVTYEKQGNWSSALEIYKRAQMLNKSDMFAQVLAKKAEEMLAIQRDAARNERVDKLVKDLAQRYKQQQKGWSKSEDEWTSRPLIMTFVDFQEKGGLTEADGYSMVLTTQLSDLLNASGRVKVVERVIMERLLEELNLGSSELADKETVLRLGKVLAAKLIGTGTMLHMPEGTLLSMRLIDTETSALAKVITEQLGSRSNLEKELNRLNRDILKTVMQSYPLKGFVVQMTDGKVMLNLGQKQGVVLGTRFNVVEDQKPITYKGKELKSAPKTIGELQIVQVEPDLSYAKIINTQRDLKQDDKVMETIAVQ